MKPGAYGQWIKIYTKIITAETINHKTSSRNRLRILLSKQTAKLAWNLEYLI